MASSRLSLVKTTGDDGLDRVVNVSISKVGGSLHQVNAKPMPWGALVSRLTTDKRTDMSHKKYAALSADAKSREKMRAGFLFGGICEKGYRANASVQSRALVNLDVDDISVEDFNQFVFDCNDPEASPLNEFEYVWYTTRSHTPDKPKFRIILPFETSCDPEKYIAIARIIASKLDSSMKLIDKVSFVLAQMMYWPLTNSDGEFRAGRNVGKFIDVDAELEGFGDWRDFSKLPAKDDEDLSTLQARGTRAGDPLKKPGIIGAFNRAYSIEDAIDQFLPHIYEKTISTDRNLRYTYLQSSTGQTGGMIVYPKEGLMFSHHSSDPLGNGHEYNAFDMVRLHLYGHEDKLTIANPTHTKSFKLFEKQLDDDALVRAEMLKENYDFEAMISSVMGEAAVRNKPVPKAKPKPKVDPLDDLNGEPAPEAVEEEDDGRDELGNPFDWPKTLEITSDGIIKPTVSNIMKILTNDPRVKHVLAYNEFRRSIVKMNMFPDGALGKAGHRVYRDVPVMDDTNGELWSDSDDNKMRLFLSLPRGQGQDKAWYDIQAADNVLNTAVSLAADANRFNPVKNFFEKEKWDGKARLDTLFIDYLGCADNEYHRLAARLTLIAAVDRVYNPGSKYDYVPILEGFQGIQKSTFIRTLANEWFAELRAHALEDSRMMAELFEGCLFIEIPELHSFTKAESSALKSFFSALSDKARGAFERRTSENKRMVIFWGSTNERTYLKDPTGNRRFLPILCVTVLIDIERLKYERSQLWAEAYELWRAMREEQPRGDLPLYFPRDGEAARIAKILQDAKSIETSDEQSAGTLESWLDTPAPAEMANCNSGSHVDMMDAMDAAPKTSGDMVRRDRTCIVEIVERSGLFDSSRVNSRVSQQVGAAMRQLKGWKSGGKAKRLPKPFGLQRFYVRVGGVYDIEEDDI